MADPEILNVLIKLQNPEVFNQLEKLKSQDYEIKFRGSFDKGVQDIVALKDKKINITADSSGILSALKDIENSLLSIHKLQNFKMNLTGNTLDDLERVRQAILEIQAAALAPQLSRLGYVQNNNPKTLVGGTNSINQAQALQDIEREAARRSATYRAQNVTRGPIYLDPSDPKRERLLPPTGQSSAPEIRELANEVRKAYNAGQFSRTLGGPINDSDQLSARQSRARRQEAEFIREDRITFDNARIVALDPFQRGGIPLNNARDLIQKATQETIAQNNRNLSSQVSALDPFQKGSVSLSSASNTAKFFAFANRDEVLKIQQDKQNDELRRIQFNNPIKVSTLSDIDPFGGPKSRSLDQTKRNLAAFKKEMQEQEQEKIRDSNIDAYNRSIAPYSLLSNNPLNKRKGNGFGPIIPPDQRNSDQLKELRQEVGLGILGEGGVFKKVFSLLGATAGAAVPGGAIIGGAIGGALFEGVAKSFEGITDAIKDVTAAGLEYQKTIVALTGVLQANVVVTAADGSQLSDIDQIQANSRQATRIQRAARSELLPLGIGGESEATLVQGLISGFSQRGIILSPEQTKVVSGRLGAAIVGLAPQLLSNSVQLRKDVEDIGANSPNAGRTTLGVALRNLTPDLFRTLSTGDDVVKATERLEQFKKAIQNSDQASVQLLRLSGSIDKLRTSAGDSFLQGLAPAFKQLADVLSKDDISDAIGSLAKAFGKGLGGFIKLVAGGIDLLTASAKNFVSFMASIGITIPGLQEKENTVSKPRKDVEIAALLRNLGIENAGENLDKVINSEPRTRFDRLQRAEGEVIRAQDGSLEDKFLPTIFLGESDALKKALAADLSRIDTYTFGGRKEAANTTLASDDRQAAVLNKGISLAQYKYQKAVDSGNENEQFRQAALINTYSDQLGEVLKQRANAERELTLVSLDEIKALEGVRNASEAVTDAQYNQVKAYGELNRSLAQAKSDLDSFGKKADLAFASEEEKVLQAAKEVELAGGISPIVNIDERLKEAKLNRASANFNAIAEEAGLRGAGATRGGEGIGLPRSGSPFAEALDRQKEALAASIDSIINELDKLPRALRNALEAFKDTKARTDLLFGKNTDVKNPTAPSAGNPPGSPGSSPKPGGPTTLNPRFPGFVGTGKPGDPIRGGITSGNDGEPLQGGVSVEDDTLYVPGFTWDGKPVKSMYNGSGGYYSSNGNFMPGHGNNNRILPGSAEYDDRNFNKEGGLDRYAPGLLIDGEPVKSMYNSPNLRGYYSYGSDYITSKNWDLMHQGEMDYGNGYTQEDMDSRKLPVLPALKNITDLVDPKNLISNTPDIFDQDLFYKGQEIDRKLGVIPNASIGTASAKGKAIYSDIVGGMLDSNSKNIRPFDTSTYLNNVLNKDKGADNGQALIGAVKQLLDAVTAIPKAISEETRKGIESSFGGK